MQSAESATQKFACIFGHGKQSVGLMAQSLTLEELLARCTTHALGDKDSAEYIMPGELAPCPVPCRNDGRGEHSRKCAGGELHKLDRNVQALHCLFIDLDKLDSAALDAAVAAVEATGLRFACYSTPSYAPPAKANARFVFPLASPVPAADWKRVYPALLAATGLKGADPACGNVGRHYYLPTKPNADAPTFARQGGTHLLEIPRLTVVPAAPPASDIIGLLRAEAEYPEHVALVERIARGEPLAEEGGRHRAILQATMLLARVGAQNINALLPSLRAMGDDEDFITDAERALDTAPVEDPPEVIAFREQHAEQAGTDQAFAARFTRLCSDRARYVPGIGWRVWDGQRWVAEDGEPVQLAATLGATYEEDHRQLKADLARTLAQSREAAPGSEAGRRLAEKYNRLAEKEEKFHKRLVLPTQNVGPASAFLRAAAKLLTTTADAFDADPWVLNVANGCVDLRTAILKPHSPDALCMKLAPVAYDPAASCPVFQTTLNQCLPDADVRGFFQRAVGYALTGDMRDHVMFLLLGTGGNGKSLLLNTIANALGDYAGTVPKSLLMSSKFDRAQSHELADLRGQRFCQVMEISERERMDSSRLKSVVGGDRITAARKYENAITFRTEAKLFMPCNDKPRIFDDDAGAWQRIVLIEFPQTFRGTEKENRELSEKLRSEAPGILAWAIRGCLEWQRIGLAVPEVCRKAADEYRFEENDVAQFVLWWKQERGTEGTMRAADLYRAYMEWAQQAQIQPRNIYNFSKRLRAQGLRSEHTRTGNVWVWTAD